MQQLAAVVGSVLPTGRESHHRGNQNSSRLTTWRENVERRTGELCALARTDEDWTAIEQAREAELARGPCFSRVRRNARPDDGRVGISDRNDVARAIFRAEQIARGLWKADRSEARQNKRRIQRTLSRIAIDVLRAIGRLAVKHRGRVFPSLEGLAFLVGVSRRTVCRAVRELEAWGLLEIVRRSKRLGGLFPRVVQATSLYLIRPVLTGLARLASLVLGVEARSECQTGPARSSSTGIEGEKTSAIGKLERFIPLPARDPSGSRRIPWQAMVRSARK